jgi:hypothetical protein
MTGGSRNAGNKNSSDDGQGRRKPKHARFAAHIHINASYALGIIEGMLTVDLVVEQPFAVRLIEHPQAQERVLRITGVARPVNSVVSCSFLLQHIECMKDQPY